MKTIYRLSVLGLVLALSNSFAVSQIFDTRPGKAPDISTMRTSLGAYYNFGSETGLNITVSLWGYVRNPGRYVIPSGSNLVEFLSYAGGPSEGADLSEVKVYRKVLARDSTIVERTFTYDIEEILARTSVAKTREGGVPTMFPGDIVVVDGSTRGQWMNVVSIIVQVIWAVTSVITTIRVLSGK
jgi:hypothetical protein